MAGSSGANPAGANAGRLIGLLIGRLIAAKREQEKVRRSQEVLGTLDRGGQAPPEQLLERILGSAGSLGQGGELAEVPAAGEGLSLPPGLSPTPEISDAAPTPQGGVAPTPASEDAGFFSKLLNVGIAQPDLGQVSDPASAATAIGSLGIRNPQTVEGLVGELNQAEQERSFGELIPQLEEMTGIEGITPSNLPIVLEIAKIKPPKMVIRATTDSEGNDLLLEVRPDGSTRELHRGGKKGGFFDNFPGFSATAPDGTTFAFGSDPKAGARTQSTLVAKRQQALQTLRPRLTEGLEILGRLRTSLQENPGARGRLAKSASGVTNIGAEIAGLSELFGIPVPTGGKLGRRVREFAGISQQEAIWAEQLTGILAAVRSEKERGPTEGELKAARRDVSRAIQGAEGLNFAAIETLTEVLTESFNSRARAAGMEELSAPEEKITPREAQSFRGQVMRDAEGNRFIIDDTGTPVPFEGP